MGVKITGRLTGPTSMELTHGPSGAVTKTTPPADNGGDGSAFSPTDLAAASLGSCAVTTLALYAQRHEIPLRGARFEIEKLMHLSPRRLGKLVLKVVLDTPASEEDFEKLVEAGRTCPVKRSLAGEVEVEETYTRA